MALTPSFCRGAARRLPIDTRTILGSSFFPRHPTSNPANNGQGSFRWPSQYWPSAFAAFVATRAAYDACDDRDVNARCMEPCQEYGAKGGRRSILTSGAIVIDHNDPNDQAFNLADNHGFGITRALEYTNAPSSYQGLSQRMRRHNVQVQRRDKQIQEAAQGGGEVVGEPLPPSPQALPLHRRADVHRPQRI